MIASKTDVAQFLTATRTRLLLPHTGEPRPPHMAGDTIPVHTQIGRLASVRLHVSRVTEIRLGDLADVDAREHGHPSLDELMATWVQTHGAWNEQALAWQLHIVVDHRQPIRQTTDGAPWTDTEAALVDPAWENEEADRRRDAHTGRLDDLAARRRSQREQLSLGQRLDRALTAARGMSTAPARNYGPKVTTPGASGSANLAGSPLADQSDVIDLDRHTFVIRKRVEEIEREIDAARGVSNDHRPVTPSTPGGTGRRLMSQETYDRLLTDPECRGRRPEELAEAMPYLGSARTIRRRRSELGLRGVDGTQTEQRGAA